ncbi:MAG: hypothetical protein LBG19_05730 [Prevotellaceae bacterium]|jgi:hypothetical protein|nr:hypothetical protein [Prevotellaceae bacterium]
MVLTIMRFFRWFNPFYNKYAKELRLVNEYAADRSVAREVGITAYMRIMADNSEHEQGSVFNAQLWLRRTWLFTLPRYDKALLWRAQ